MVAVINHFMGINPLSFPYCPYIPLIQKRLDELLLNWGFPATMKCVNHWGLGLFSSIISNLQMPPLGFLSI